MQYRNLVTKLFHKKLTIFDSINNSIDFRANCVDLLGTAPEFPQRMALHEQVSKLVQDQPITYLEFGVWKGESLNKWLTLNTHPDSTFTGFDTFTGLPEDWTARDPKGAFSTDGQIPALADARAALQIGLFQTTLYPFLDRCPPTRQLVVHVDCDLYSSTLFVLTVLDRYFAPGTILIFDDFHSLNHEFAAWCDYRRAFSHQQWHSIGKTYHCVQAAVRLQGN